VDNCSISGGEHTGTGLKKTADGINSAVKCAESQGFSALNCYCRAARGFAGFPNRVVVVVTVNFRRCGH
jgi:hypothetical protein